MKTLFFSNQKGGCGKTIIGYNCGCDFAINHNKKVLFIDLDGQSNLTSVLTANPDEIEKKGKYSGKMLTSKESAKNFIINVIIPGDPNKTEVSLIPSSQQNYALEYEINAKKGREFLLLKKLQDLSEYDLILFDTPPSMGVYTLNALIASNHVLLIHDSSDFSTDGLSQIIQTTSEIQDDSFLNQSNTKILGTVWNSFEKASKIINELTSNDLAEAEEILSHKFHPIRKSTEIEKAQREKKPVFIFNPRHDISKDIQELSNQILSKI
jgi:chromosome partitioning protein